MKFRNLTPLSVLAFAIGCSSGGDTPEQGSTGSKTNTISVSLTDAATDLADRVYTSIGGVSLNFEDSGWVEHNFDTPMKIDLLTLQAGNSISLLDGVEAQPGTYEVRLNLYKDDDNVLDNSIVLTDGGQEYELFIPSGTETGIKLSSPITVLTNKSANYTIDFDVRKSVVKRGQEHRYILKPVLRLVDNSNVGEITGTITDTTLLTTDCSDQDPLTNNVIYIYEGFDVIPDDIGSSGADPVSTANVVFDESTGEYGYKAAFLTAGDYTVSFTCNSDLDNIESDDELNFKMTSNVTVTTMAPASEPAQEESEEESENEVDSEESKE